MKTACEEGGDGHIFDHEVEQTIMPGQAHVVVAYPGDRRCRCGAFTWDEACDMLEASGAELTANVRDGRLFIERRDDA